MEIVIEMVCSFAEYFVLDVFVVYLIRKPLVAGLVSRMADLATGTLEMLAILVELMSFVVTDFQSIVFLALYPELVQLIGFDLSPVVLNHQTFDWLGDNNLHPVELLKIIIIN